MSRAACITAIQVTSHKNFPLNLFSPSMFVILDFREVHFPRSSSDIEVQYAKTFYERPGSCLRKSKSRFGNVCTDKRWWFLTDAPLLHTPPPLHVHHKLPSVSCLDFLTLRRVSARAMKDSWAEWILERNALRLQKISRFLSSQLSFYGGGKEEMLVTCNRGVANISLRWFTIKRTVSFQWKRLFLTTSFTMLHSRGLFSSAFKALKSMAHTAVNSLLAKPYCNTYP